MKVLVTHAKMTKYSIEATDKQAAKEGYSGAVSGVKCRPVAKEGHWGCEVIEWKSDAKVADRIIRDLEQNGASVFELDTDVKESNYNGRHSVIINVVGAEFIAPASDYFISNNGVVRRLSANGQAASLASSSNGQRQAAPPAPAVARV